MHRDFVAKEPLRLRERDWKARVAEELANLGTTL